MTTMKKLASLVLAAMMLCVCVAANAATITINGSNDAAAYSIYTLFTATVDENDDTKISYTVNPKYADVLEAVVGEDTDPIAYLSGLTADSEALNTFAEEVYEAIVTAALPADATTTGDAPSEDVGSGYVLVAETSLGDAADTFSLHMLSTVKKSNITINTKESVPSLEKKLKETNDTTGVVSEWQDGADYDVGDEVPFKLTGTLSSKYADYETYYYQFVDVICDGLTFDADSVTVSVDNGGTLTNVTGAFTTTVTDDNFTVTCQDLKTIEDVTINADSKIVVEYTATLNDQSVIGPEGNPNKAMLVYNNNPYYDGTGTGDDAPDSEKNTSETPWDQVIVFTYELDITKVDSSNEELTGASFALYKKVMGDDGTVSEVLVDEIDGAATSEFLFQRLDAGEYIIKETAAPAGYNPVADIEFTITADYQTEADEPAFGSLTVDHNDMTVADGTISTSIKNFSGTELPTTGGIGTTIFYVVGGVLVLLAVVLLVTKRRVGEEN